MDTTIYAGIDGGGVYRSTNNGLSWVAVNNGLTNLKVFTLAVNNGSIFSGTLGGGAFYSIDNGELWAPVNNGLSDTYVFSFFMNGNDLFSGTYNGKVFLSNNNGSSWNSVNTGFTGSSIRNFAVNNGYLFAGTAGSSVWRRPLSDFQSSTLPLHPKGSGLQTKLRISSLASGYQLTYTLPTACFVELSIYSMSGKRVAILEQGVRPAGAHTQKFVGGRLPSGMYIYRFKAGSYETGGRLMLTK
jgi:hypothetical protein